MFLKEVLSWFREEKEYKALLAAVHENGKPILISGLCEPARLFFMASLIEDVKTGHVLIAPTERDAHLLASQLENFYENVYLYLEREFVFSHVTHYSKDKEQERLEVLFHLLKSSKCIIVTTAQAASQFTIPRDVLKERVINIKTNDNISFSDLTEKLILAGYTKTELVEGRGQFAQRGGIIDVFSPGNENPIRIDFFGNYVEHLSSFDVSTQRRIEKLDYASLLPIKEILLNNITNRKVRDEITALYKQSKDNTSKTILEKELEALENNETLSFLDRFISLVYSKHETLIDYCQGFLFHNLDPLRIRSSKVAFDREQNIEIEDLVTKGLTKFDFVECFATTEDFFADFKSSMLAYEHILTGNDYYGYKNSFVYDTSSLISFSRNLEVLLMDLDRMIELQYSIIILSSNSRSAANLESILNDRGFKSKIIKEKPEDGLINIYVPKFKSNVSGFEAEGKFALISDLDDNRKTSSNISKRKRRQDRAYKSEKITQYTDLSEGDLIVHVNHGIGRFEGIINLVTQGVSKDFIKVVYADNGILYVPVNQLDMISKYIGGKEDTKLAKMGSLEWKRAKSRARKSAGSIAKELIKLYAERQSKQGFAFGPDDELQEEFEFHFEHTETDDQTVASIEVKRDMEKNVPMDRLLCGDVGFGKTEVAIRATFKCVFGGKQAVILVPTTILALQHFITFQSRFRGYPVNVAMMSRFVSNKEQKEIVEKFSAGEIDILIGTHGILHRKIDFKNLGLLVVDEEQRFGVRHKERIKSMSSNVHVLTLTATPIPRTLNMALSGIRDMSVLEEAPADRTPVQTYVLEHDEDTIVRAIQKELNRGGQVFYLFNFIDGIYSKAAKIKELFPDNSVEIAHGKIDREVLSDIWSDMLNGKIDILVCTTIIETGVDVHNANTLIIEEANRLGLSQLYQIRGRVGRSTRKAWAYLTYREESVISEIAYKRLGAIKEFTEFGSGFKIAMRDLELRGAGNLLGAQQSGHMEEIGYDLYLRILEEAVNEEKGFVKPIEVETTVDFLVDAFIPEDYIGSSKVRMDIYRKIAAIIDKNDMKHTYEELEDRFGTVPKSVENLIKISFIRKLAGELKIHSVEQKESVCVFYSKHFMDEDIKILVKSSDYKGKIMYSTGTNPYLTLKLYKEEMVLEEVIGFLVSFIKG